MYKGNSLNTLYLILNTIPCRGGGMADTGALRAPVRKGVRVRLSPAAQFCEAKLLVSYNLLLITNNLLRVINFRLPVIVKQIRGIAQLARARGLGP